MKPLLTANGLHRADFTVVGDLSHGTRQISIAHITRADTPRRLQWHIDGVYHSGTASKAAEHLERWVAALPPGPRMALNSEAIEIARWLRDYRGEK